MAQASTAQQAYYPPPAPPMATFWSPPNVNMTSPSANFPSLEPTMPMAYFNLPDNAKCLFSTGFGKREKRLLEMPGQPPILRSNLENDVYEMANQLRKEWPDQIQDVVAPEDWQGLYHWFDAHDLYSMGAPFLLQVLRHIASVNETIHKEKMAVLTEWADWWIKENQSLITRLSPYTPLLPHVQAEHLDDLSPKERIMLNTALNAQHSLIISSQPVTRMPLVQHGNSPTGYSVAGPRNALVAQTPRAHYTGHTSHMGNVAPAPHVPQPTYRNMGGLSNSQSYGSPSRNASITFPRRSPKSGNTPHTDAFRRSSQPRRSPQSKHTPKKEVPNDRPQVRRFSSTTTTRPRGYSNASKQNTSDVSRPSLRRNLSNPPHDHEAPGPVYVLNTIPQHSPHGIQPIINDPSIITHGAIRNMPLQTPSLCSTNALMRIPAYNAPNSFNWNHLDNSDGLTKVSTLNGFKFCSSPNTIDPEGRQTMYIAEITPNLFCSKGFMSILRRFGHVIDTSFIMQHPKVTGFAFIHFDSSAARDRAIEFLQHFKFPDDTVLTVNGALKQTKYGQQHKSFTQQSRTYRPHQYSNQHSRAQSPDNQSLTDGFQQQLVASTLELERDAVLRTQHSAALTDISNARSGDARLWVPPPPGKKENVPIKSSAASTSDSNTTRQATYHQQGSNSNNGAGPQNRKKSGKRSNPGSANMTPAQSPVKSKITNGGTIVADQLNRSANRKPHGGVNSRNLKINTKDSRSHELTMSPDSASTSFTVNTPVQSSTTMTRESSIMTSISSDSLKIGESGHQKDFSVIAILKSSSVVHPDSNTILEPPKLPVDALNGSLSNRDTTTTNAKLKGSNKNNNKNKNHKSQNKNNQMSNSGTGSNNKRKADLKPESKPSLTPTSTIKVESVEKPKHEVAGTPQQKAKSSLDLDSNAEFPSLDPAKSPSSTIVDGKRPDPPPEFRSPNSAPSKATEGCSNHERINGQHSHVAIPKGLGKSGKKPESEMKTVEYGDPLEDDSDALYINEHPCTLSSTSTRTLNGANIGLGSRTWPFIKKFRQA